MLETTTIKAKFNGLNTNDGKCVLKFTLDPESFAELPELVKRANNTVNVDIYTDQTVLFVDSDTGEYIEDECEETDAEPVEDEYEGERPILELPPAEIEPEWYEDDDAA